MKLLRRTAVFVLLLLLSVFPSVMSAEEDYEAVPRLLKNIEGLKNEIKEADSAITKAMADLNIGATPDARKAVHNAIDRYCQIAANNTRQIDNEVRSLVAINPNSSIPTITPSSHEAEIINHMQVIEDNQRELDRIMTTFLQVHKFVTDAVALAEQERDIVSFVEKFDTMRTVFKHIAFHAIKTAVVLPFFPQAAVGGAITGLADIAYIIYNHGSETLAVEKKRDEYKKAAEDAMNQYNLLKPAAAGLDALAQEFKVDMDKFRKAREEVEKIQAAWPGLVNDSKAAQSNKALKVVQETKTKAQSMLSSVPSTWIKYTPLDRSILKVLTSAYDEVKSSGNSGYDVKRMQTLLKDYDDKKKPAFEKWNKAYEEARKQVNKRADAIRAACTPWTPECSVRYENEVTKANDYLWRSYSADRTLYEAEEKEIPAQALVRAAKMNEYLASGMKTISSKFMTQYDAITKELNALNDIKRTKAQRPPFQGGFPYFFIASQARSYNAVTAEKPGDITDQNYGLYMDLEGWRSSVEQGITVLTDLVKKEEALFKDIQQASDAAWNSYMQLAPASMIVKDKPVLWASDPNRYYGSGFALYAGGFRFGQIEIGSYGFSVKFSAMSMHKDLEWLKKFLEDYDKDMPIVEGFLIDDARGLKVERIGSRLIDALNAYNFSGDWEKEKEIALKRFTYKDKVSAPGISPDQSDGARYLEEMKAAWEARKDDIEEIMKAFKQKSVSKLVYNYKNPFTYRPAIESMTKIPEKIKLYEDIYAALKSGKDDSGKDINAVKDFYSKFKDAYESKDDSKIMSFMGDEWEAGDGTTLSDLQANLRTSFGIFDEIKYSLQNQTVKALKDGLFSVTYDVTITSRIYDGNLKHEEKSSVSEEVIIDKSGKPRIYKTMSGRFWFVE